ncbi:MAG: hypothetical protein DVB29_06150 [Verrucomicrobia bacterium]|jgi:hypothetical protein|nr:MAG: hypothetical protein DVB29_06150 [Verrucomicrobiota bacterium]MDH4469908.1 hypothetical protein [Verrucomicrobiae bacterium]
MFIPPKKPIVQRSLSYTTPASLRDLLNDSREQSSEDIFLLDYCEELSPFQKRTLLIGDTALGSDWESFGAPPLFNPCKLLHMNIALKV